MRIYDPTASTVEANASAIWSPLQQADTVLGAQRAARALCDAVHGVGWRAHGLLAGAAEILLSGLMYVAHHVHRDMGAVCECLACAWRSRR